METSNRTIQGARNYLHSTSCYSRKAICDPVENYWQQEDQDVNYKEFSNLILPGKAKHYHLRKTAATKNLSLSNFLPSSDPLMYYAICSDINLSPENQMILAILF